MKRAGTESHTCATCREPPQRSRHKKQRATPHCIRSTRIVMHPFRAPRPPSATRGSNARVFYRALVALAETAVAPVPPSPPPPNASSKVQRSPARARAHPCALRQSAPAFELPRNIRRARSLSLAYINDVSMLLRWRRASLLARSPPFLFSRHLPADRPTANT